MVDVEIWNELLLAILNYLKLSATLARQRISKDEEQRLVNEQCKLSTMSELAYMSCQDVS